MDFWRLVAIFNRRKWLILLSVLITSACALGASRIVGSRWIATVRIAYMDSQLAKLTGSEAGEGGSRALQAAKDQADVYTSIIKSDSVLRPTLDALKSTYPTIEEVDHDGIEIEATSPRMFELRVTDSFPARAKDLANALAEKFVEQNHKLATRQALKAVAVLEDQLRHADSQLRDARKKYDDYCARNGIYGDSNQGLRQGLNRLQAAQQQRDSLNERRASLQAQLQAKLAKVDLKPKLALKPRTAAPQLIQSTPALESMEFELRDLDIQIDSLGIRYTPQYPKVRELKSKRENLMARIDGEKERIRSENASKLEQHALAMVEPREASSPDASPDLQLLRDEITGLDGQIRASGAVISDAQEEITKTKGTEGLLAVLVGDVQDKQEQRTNVSVRVHQAKSALDVTERQSPLAVASSVNEFNPVINATAGRTKKLLLLAALCALIGTSGLVVAFDSIDKRLKNVSEAQSKLPSGVITAIPQPNGQMGYAELALAAQLRPRSLHAESYRFLAHHLLSQNRSAARSIMIVSAKGHQGSTTTLTNLGISLAQAGKRVILVDANVRTSELHQVFDIENEYGYMDVLRDTDPSSFDRAVRETSVPNLRVVTAGPNPENPWELFRSSNLQRVSAQLLDDADYVLYDTPSALLFTDALNLAPVVDGAFLCVRALEVPTGAEERLVKMLEQSNVEILGTVLTDVPSSVLEGHDTVRHYFGSIQGTQDGHSGPGYTDGTDPGLMSITAAPDNSGSGASYKEHV